MKISAADIQHEIARWGVCVLLMIPAFALYAGHYFNCGAGIPTGFIAYDMPYYLANAREYLDAGQFGFGYGNPFSPYPDTPRIYFQPLSAFLALAGKTTGLPLETLWIIFLVIAGLLFIRSTMSLFSQTIGLETISSRIVFVIFFWGGGLFPIAGALRGLWLGQNAYNLFHFDPFRGWWFLNLGRNIIFPTEAFYHFIVFSLIVAVLRKRLLLAVFLSALISASHPFTGIQFLLILILWSFTERYYWGNSNPPVWFVAALEVITICHILYYMVWLPSWMEHASVMRQWRLPWLLQGWPMFLAYSIPAIFFIYRVRRSHLTAEVFISPANRLLACWLFVSLLLANHEFLMDPIQPIHFARGYIWSALFILAAPAIIDLVNRLTKKPFSIGRLLGVMAILLVFLSDNFLWFDNEIRNPHGVYLTADSKEVLDYLKTIDVDSRKALLVSDDLMISYLATVYTPLRIWYGHDYCTPFAAKRLEDLRRFYQTCREPDRWSSRILVIVSTQTHVCGGDNGSLLTNVHEVFHNSKYNITMHYPVPERPPPSKSTGMIED